MRFYKLALVLLIISFAFAQNSYQVYFNEVNAADGGAGEEFIELVGPSGTSLTGLIITHYNGSASSDGGLWSYTIGPGAIIPDDCGNGKGFYVIGESGVTNVDESPPVSYALQDGEDGLILYDTDGTTILDAIAWQGEGDMTTDDPGTVSTAVGSEQYNYLLVTSDDNSSTASLQALNPVVNGTPIDWGLSNPMTPGALNNDQNCDDVSLPVELANFKAEKSIHGVQLIWRTESEFENIGFIIERKTDGADWLEIVSYKTDELLLGQGTTSYPWDYEYIDKFVEKGKKYYYRLADVDQNNVVTYHKSESVVVESSPLGTSPDRLSLSTYPNPFNPTINIVYSVFDNDINVKIDIYNINGELVRSLLDKNQSQGWHSIQWSGLNSEGNAVPGGTYICQIKAGNEVRNNKIVYLK